MTMADWWHFPRFLGFKAVTQQYGVAVQHAKYSIKLARVKGDEKNQDANYENTKIKAVI